MENYIMRTTRTGESPITIICDVGIEAIEKLAKAEITRKVQYQLRTHASEVKQINAEEKGSYSLSSLMGDKVPPKQIEDMTEAELEATEARLIAAKAARAAEVAARLAEVKGEAKK